jgi:hypothetical protein
MARLAGITLLIALLAGPGPAAERLEVDVELVLAVDISRSMDYEELRIQRDGYVAALRDPQVQRAIADGMLGRIALTYVEWAGTEVSDTLVDWTLIDGPAAAEDFATRLEAARLSGARGTSISAALAHSAAMIRDNGFVGLKRVIDVSGDGPNNIGRGVEAVRDEVVEEGIVINGLPVMLKAYDGPFSLENLDIYYQDCVIGGPAAFALSVYEAAKFTETIRRKLILEIAGGIPLTHFAQFEKPAPRIDCLIGEQRMREWLQQMRWE